MAKKIVVNPRYEHLREYIQSVPENFDSLGEVLEARRNVLRQHTVDGVTLVIKSFRRIYLPNRIRYSFFYPSKAQRAFDYGNVLLDKGFNTPAPIAYIEVKRYGLISQSYFISEYLDFQPLQSVVKPASESVSEWIADFVKYTYRLHESNIYHVDYTLGNVLFKKQANGYEFALVDNNRMRFGPVSLRKGILNLVSLAVSVVDSTVMAKQYALLRQTDATTSIGLLYHFKVVGSRKTQVRLFFKRLVKELRFCVWTSLLMMQSLYWEISPAYLE
jgi:hypothetical protein